MSFWDYLKSFFFLLLLLQFAPPMIEGIYKQYSRYIKPKAQVGVLSIQGTIYDSSYYNRHLHKFFHDPAIKAILLKIECPGGASGSSQAVHNELQALKAEFHKPVVVLVENVCASGGYYIASAADYIIAPGTAMIGSIGAYMPYYFQLKEFIEQFKIKYTAVKAGGYKGVGDPFVDPTKEDLALLQGVVDDSYQQFAADIAKNRKLGINDMAQWAEGRIFSGRQALKLGLIDEIGSAYNVVKVIKEKALIEGEIEWVRPPQPASWTKLFDGGQSEDDTTLFASFAESICTHLENRYLTAKVQ